MEVVFLELVAPYILGILLFLVASMLMHEYGHFLAAESRGFEPRWFGSWKPLRLGIRTNGNENLEAQVYIIERGVLLGLLTSFMSFVFLGVWGFVVLVGYLWGCLGDFKELRKLRRNIRFVREQDGVKEL